MGSRSRIMAALLALGACGDSGGAAPAPGGDSTSSMDEASSSESDATDSMSDQPPAGEQGGGVGAPSSDGGDGAPSGGGGSGAPSGAGGSDAPAPSDGGGSPDAGGVPEPGTESDGGAGETPVETCDANLEANPPDADPCTAPLRPGEDRLCEFDYGGQTRKFYIYAPPSYNACEPAAMIMDCHGATESAEVHIGQERFNPDSPLGYGSSWRRAIQGDNAIVVTPEGVGLFWSQANDPAFLNEVADMVEVVADVDPEKRYLTGISMGGMITVETGCQDTSRWRGMVPVAMLSNSCGSIDRPIPHMSFHATTDAITSYADDQDLADEMVELNGCDPTPDTVYYGGPNSSSDPVCFETLYGPGSPDAEDPYAVPLAPCPTDRPESSCQVWSGCDEGVEVAFCTVEAANQNLGGHLLYTNDTGLNLARLAWQFLKKF